jgi:hypothetical protein
MPDGQDKQAQEVAIARMRAFEVGVAHFCKDADVSYSGLAKTAAAAAEQVPEMAAFKGATEETLGPKLVEAMVAAGEQQQG